MKRPRVTPFDSKPCFVMRKWAKWVQRLQLTSYCLRDIHQAYIQEFLLRLSGFAISEEKMAFRGGDLPATSAPSVRRSSKHGITEPVLAMHIIHKDLEGTATRLEVNSEAHAMLVHTACFVAYFTTHMRTSPQLSEALYTPTADQRRHFQLLYASLPLYHQFWQPPRWLCFLF